MYSYALYIYVATLILNMPFVKKGLVHRLLLSQKFWSAKNFNPGPKNIGSRLKQYFCKNWSGFKNIDPPSFYILSLTSQILQHNV